MTGLRLGVVTPMANEAATAVAFVQAVLGECARYPFGAVRLYVVIDRVSLDATHDLLDTYAETEAQLRVIWAPESRGVADAYLRGYRSALEDGCDWILELDAGFSHDPTVIGSFLEAMARGNDCVFGTRFRSGGANHGAFRRRVVSRIGTLLANALLGTRLSDMTSGFELFTRASLEHVLAQGIRSRGPFFQTEIKAHCRRFRVAEVPIRYEGGNHPVGTRAIGESLVNLARLFVRRLSEAR